MLLEYFYHFFITALIFILFFSLLTGIGFIVFLGFKRLVSISHLKTSLLTTTVLSFSMGFTVYLNLGLILIIFKVFNFYLVYFPLIIINIFLVSYLIIKKRGTLLEIKKKLKNSKNSLKHNLSSYKSIAILVLLLIIQFLMQWKIITNSRSLISSDTYFYLKFIYYLKDNYTLTPSLSTYPPGIIILCTGATLISDSYMISYYFLKFGGIFFLSLLVIFTFGLSLKLFQKRSVAFLTSLLLLAYYLYIWRLNAFYASSLAVFFIFTTLFILQEDQVYFSMLGFIFPLTFLINPVVTFFNIILFSCFVMYNLWSNRQINMKQQFKSILLLLGISFITSISYLFYQIYLGQNVLGLILSYAERIFAAVLSQSYSSIFSSSFSLDFPLLFSFLLSNYNLIQNFLDFFKEPRISVAFITFLVYSLLAILGFLYESPVNRHKRLHITCKFSLLLIVLLYLLTITFLHNFYFFSLYIDRIFAIFCPFTVFLCGFGMQSIYFLFKKLIKKIIQKNPMMIKKWNVAISHFRFLNFNFMFTFFLGILLLGLIISQQEMISKFDKYYFNDNLIESYLYVQENTPSNAKVRTPEFKYHGLLDDSILYDKEVKKWNLDRETTYKELVLFIVNNKIDYLMVEESEISISLLSRILNHSNYEIRFNNTQYYIIQYSSF